MRLVELTLHRVGYVRALAPIAIGPRLTVILGDNEAGKSTLRRAVEALLFGTRRSLTAPLIEAAFHLAARVSMPDGRILELERRGRTLTGTGAQDAELCAWLRPELADRSRDLFAIGSESLRAGGEMLREEGAIGRVLFAAATGIPPGALERLERDLDAQVKAHESRASGASGLRMALMEAKRTKGELDACARYDRFDEAARTVAQREAEVEDARARFEAASLAVTRLEQLRDGLGDRSALRAAEHELARLAEEGAIAPASFELRLASLAAELDAKLDALRASERAHTEAEEALARAPVPSGAEALADACESAARAGAAMDKVEEERFARTRALGDARLALRSRLAAVEAPSATPPTDDALVARAHAAVAPRATLDAIVRLAEEADALRRALRAQADQEAEARAKREGAARELAALGDDRVDALEHAHAVASRACASADAARTASRAESDASGRAEALATSLGLREEALPTHDVSGWRPAWERWNAATADAARCARELEACVARYAAAEVERSAMLRTGDAAVPDRARLASARDARAAALADVRDAVEGSEALGRAEARARLELLSGAIATADDVIDRRFAEAAHVGALEAREDAVRKRGEERADAEARLARAEEVLAAATEAWRACWPFLAAPPENPEAWCTRLLAMREAREVRAHHAAERARADEDAQRTGATLARMLEASAPTLMRLEEPRAVLEGVERALADARRRRHDAAVLRGALDLAQASIEAACARRTALEIADERAVGAWREAVAVLGAAPDRAADPARAWAAQQHALEAQISAVAALERDVEARSHELEAFRGRVRDLRASVLAVAPGLALAADLEGAVLARALDLAAREARANAQERAACEAALRRSAEALADTRVRSATLTATLEATFVEASLRGPFTPEAAAREAERAGRARALRTLIDAHGAALRARWGPALDAAERELAGRDAHALGVELEAGREARARLEQAYRSASEAKARAEIERDGLAAHAGEAAARAQAHETSVERAWSRGESLAALIVGRALVQAALRRASASSEPLLLRASGIFRDLTDGAYDGVVVDRSGPEPALFATRDGGDAKAVEALSLGTRDQLWLALRLAVAAEAAKITPYPLVLDDVLVHFDAPRAAAALRALATVSRDVQVVLLTHHDHVLSLARQQASEALTEHVLSRPEGAAPRALEPELGRIPRPLAPPLVAPEPERGASGGNDEQVVLELLGLATAPMSKAELLDAARAAGVELEGSWSGLIARLKDRDAVAQHGERRAARYTLGPRAREG